jgi:hypothetical protein
VPSTRSTTALKELLDSAYERYARPSFIEDHPIQIPRFFLKRADAMTSGTKYVLRTDVMCRLTEDR